MKAEEIIDLIKARNQSGLVYLYDNYSTALMGIIVRIIGSEKLAEEILQQTFLKIWDGINSFDPNKSTLFTWMSRIARNAAIDQRRLKKFDNNKKTDSLDIHVHNKNRTNIDVSKIDVDALMNVLDDKLKEVLDCVYLQGYSQSEAAKKLGIPLGTVKTRVRRAIMEFRKSLDKEKGLFVGFLLIVLLQILVLWN